MPPAQHDTGPVLRTLHHLPPLLSPDVTFNDPPRTSDFAIKQLMLYNHTLTGEDLDIMIFCHDLLSIGPNFHSPEALLNAVDHFTAYNEATLAGSCPLTAYAAHHLTINPQECAMQRQFERLVNELDLEGLYNNNDMDDSEAMPIGSVHNEDEPDPFMVEDNFHPEDQDLSDILVQHIVIYGLFHLPRVACNAMLTSLSCLLVALSPMIATLFITLQSSNHVLSVDKPICLLPICPSCCNVFPPAGSIHIQDAWNLRAVKTPLVKYPYLPLLTQIRSILKFPCLEALLDQWQQKPRVPGEYTDIFDGVVCCTQLKAPDGKLFFSNPPDEEHGPDGEL
ncbi:hypothetical protein PAXRUDRAFT_36599 [Paxillus rubicundulus Ve08.2h10]|uniref:Uncharacterized protein n=1 Tax=Paxillus rubicundulus Ve08.2h10 TaxID=930991 RepID=A0A0D0DK99_9AGAM|nr:hypothetical protein PAXRUDRAFT_36599 [Paxillus rubicundulus Ve08.2h10]